MEVSRDAPEAPHSRVSYLISLAKAEVILNFLATEGAVELRHRLRVTKVVELAMGLEMSFPSLIQRYPVVEGHPDEQHCY